MASGWGITPASTIRALVLALVFCLVVGEARTEGLTRLDPMDLGRLLGLDWALEVKTMRARMEELAGLSRGDQLFARPAEVHLETHEASCGFFYLDGRVRAYHGTARLPKAHVARARLAMAAEVDTWITDEQGRGVLCWTAEPGQSLTGEFERAAREIRALVGEQARPTIVFDRGGYSPGLFAEPKEAGFEVIGDALHVRITPLSAPRRTRAIAAICGAAAPAPPVIAVPVASRL